MTNNWVDRHYKWMFILPALVFMTVMTVIPVAMTIGFSFTDWDLLLGDSVRFNGLENYIRIICNADFWNSFVITFYYTFLATFLEMVLGVAVAVALNNEFAGKEFIKTMILLPYMMAPVAVGMMWMLFYEPSSGLINYLFGMLCLPKSGFTSVRSSVIPSIAVVEAWQMTPMVIIVCLAGLAALPKDCIEAAAIDGASVVQTFFKIKLPMLVPILFSIGLLRFIDIFKSFDLIFAMTGGGPANSSRTMNLLAYENAFSYYKFGLSSAILTLVFVLVIVISCFTLKAKNRWSIQ
ncbi:sugar ABC transporter permease [Treponema parvum]|uniref:Sugar ABC transporter permease n=1 Tax=Treponema parvum TaxID=138851 RepID=A0A975F503_9SPIR|nr:sugar ABC transporter permease [Treponema parvum]QTQ14541.1 sugar ABC transporter permease [Treponema parvum]